MLQIREAVNSDLDALLSLIALDGQRIGGHILLTRAADRCP